MRHLVWAAATIVIVLASTMVQSGSAEAHERRTVGKYTLVVGWHSEPTTEGLLNATYIRVTETAASRGVEGLEKTIRMTVRAGGSSTTYEPQLRPLSGQAGAYVGDIVPTRPGDYTFLVRGKIEELDVNEQFESGPGRFDVVRPLASASYPDAALGPGELSRAVTELRDNVAQLRILAIASIALSLIVLLVTFVRSRRRAAALALALGLALAASATEPADAGRAATIALTKTEPAANARLAVPPGRITMTFDEEIGAKSKARMLGSDGSELRTDPAKVDHDTLVLTPPSLAAGIYLVHYTAIDDADGHETIGYFAFAVGDDAPVRLRGFDLSGSGGGLTARLQIAPERAGENSYSLTGSGFERATLRFEPQEAKVGTTDLALQGSGTTFTGKGMELAVNGKAKITALLRRPGEAQDTPVPFDVTIPAPAETPAPTIAPAASSDTVATTSPVALASPASSVPPGPGSVDPTLIIAALLGLAAIGWTVRARAAR